MILEGFYKISQKNNVLCEGHNIITLLGESFFLHRAIDSEFNPIQYIVLGNSSIRANKNDLTLGNEITRKTCRKKIDLDKRQIILNCNCSVRDIENSSEIGVANDSILISHDVYELEENLLDPSLGDVEIQYVFQLATLTDRTDWKYASSLDLITYDDNDNELSRESCNIYYIYEDDNVVNVLEKNSNSGYHSVSSKEALQNTLGAYYYDVETKTLYIRTIGNDDPKQDKYEILIQTK